MPSRLDPLIGRAASWLDALGSRRRRAGAGKTAAEETPTHDVTESVADRLQAESLSR